jgi:hypothetical protein
MMEQLRNKKKNLHKVPGQVGPGGTQLKTTTTSLQRTPLTSSSEGFGCMNQNQNPDDELVAATFAAYQHDLPLNLNER